MNTVQKTLDRWSDCEDDIVTSTIRKLYGPLFQYTLIFPSWTPQGRKKTFGLIAYHFFIFAIHLYLLTMSVICLLDDFEAASLEFHFWIILSFSIAGIVMINSNRGTIAYVHHMMGTRLGRQSDGKIYNEEKAVQFEKNKRKQTIMFLFLPGFVMLIAGGVLVIPYLKKLNDPPRYNRLGVNMNLPIPGWYPFYTHEGIAHLVTILGQMTSGINMAAALATMELLIFRMTQQIIFEYKVLQYAVDTLFSRASTMYQQLTPARANKKSQTFHPEYQKCFEKCLTDCVAHHHRISQVLGCYETILKWPVAFAYICGTGVIGLSLINIQSAKKTENYENIILFSMLAVAEVLNMFIISMFGETITTECEILRNQLYFVHWHKLNVKNRRLLLNFQVGITNPVIVRAGKMIDMSMDTFSSIINTSYSFFNLMNAS